MVDATAREEEVVEEKEEGAGAVGGVADAAGGVVGVGGAVDRAAAVAGAAVAVVETSAAAAACTCSTPAGGRDTDRIVLIEMWLR